MNYRPRRGWVLTMPPRTDHVADRPRRCIVCDAPILITVDGRVITDTGKAHRCPA